MTEEDTCEYVNNNDNQLALCQSETCSSVFWTDNLQNGQTEIPNDVFKMT